MIQCASINKRNEQRCKNSAHWEVTWKPGKGLPTKKLRVCKNHMTFYMGALKGATVKKIDSKQDFMEEEEHEPICDNCNNYASVCRCVDDNDDVECNSHKILAYRLRHGHTTSKYLRPR